ncbi:hypothetical protein SGPA1_11900 [Streptomyces misionensis JCM 4497]
MDDCGGPGQRAGPGVAHRLLERTAAPAVARPGPGTGPAPGGAAAAHAPGTRPDGLRPCRQRARRTRRGRRGHRRTRPFLRTRRASRPLLRGCAAGRGRGRRTGPGRGAAPRAVSRPRHPAASHPAQQGGDRPGPPLTTEFAQPGPVFRILSGSRSLARTSAALSSVVDALRRLPPAPCICTPQPPLGSAVRHR